MSRDNCPVGLENKEEEWKAERRGEIEREEEQSETSLM